VYAECEPVDVRSLLMKEVPIKASEPMEVSAKTIEPREVMEGAMDQDLPERSKGAPGETPLTSCTKRGRPPESGSGSKAGVETSGKRVVRRKISYSLTDLEDSEWEYHENPGKRGNFVKRKRVLPSRTELGLNSQQWATVRAKTELFEVSSTADVAAEASRQLDQAENARSKCTKVKGDLNQIMKCGIAIAKQAIFRIAERASGLGEPDGAAKERVLALIKERDALRKENKLLKKQSHIRDEDDEEEDENTRGPDRVDALALAHSVAKHTRSQTSAERRRIVSTSESEGGAVGGGPFSCPQSGI